MSAPRTDARQPGRGRPPAAGDRRATLAALLAEIAQQLTEEPPPPEPAHRPMPERMLLTPEEAAQQLGVGRSTVYALIKAGQLESVQIGRVRCVPTSAVREYAARLIDQARTQQH